MAKGRVAAPAQGGAGGGTKSGRCAPAAAAAPDTERTGEGRQAGLSSRQPPPLP